MEIVINTLKTGLLLAVLTVLAGCVDKIETGDSNKAEKPAASDIVLSKDGVGPINSTTPFNIHKITLAFPNHGVVEQTNFAEGEKYPVIKVSKGVNTFLTINPDTSHTSIFSVVATSNDVGNSLGHAIGVPYSQIYTFEEKKKCAPGMEEWSGKVLCYAPGASNILYLFGGVWDGSDAKMPPENILAQWQLEAMIWKP